MVVELTLNNDSNQIQIDQVYVAHDCGLIINPDGLRNQIEGNVIQSISRAMKEEVKFDTEITTKDWISYPILNFTEIPQIEISLIDQPDEPPRGAGEPATVPTAAAIANAIFDASGIRLRTVPFTPEQVQKARQAG